jgi:hypothetical protein
MSKFKIEKGISRIKRVKLQASIEEPVATELALMCEWSNNDRNYVVNELLRFALSQDGEFPGLQGICGRFGRRRGPSVRWFRAATNRSGGQDPTSRHRIRFWCSSVEERYG